MTPPPDDATQQRLAALSALFSPRSIAIVGASDNAAKIGGIPLDYLQRFGYAGTIHPVNPKAATVQGLAAAPSLRAIGAPVDMAICAVPAALVQATLDDAVAAGVRGLVLFSSGFAEVGPEGAAAQQRLCVQARAAGIRLLGPNCLGTMNIRENVYASFTPAPGAGRVEAGHIGLVSQSGAFGAYAYSLARARGLGMSHWITTGNEADVGFADCVEWLAHDPHTQVIMGYMEGCRDGHALRRALATAQRARKPVVIVKVGRTAIGAQAAASHTAALAGDDAVYDTVLHEYGVHRARDIAEFFDIAASASIASLPRERSVGLFTLSGGVGVLMADEAADHGLVLRPMPEATQEEIRRWVPFASAVNPVDITGQVTNEPDLMERTARRMLDAGGYASWIGFLAAAGASPKFWPGVEELARNLRRDYPDRLLAISTLLDADKRRALEAMGCLAFSEPAEAVRSVAALAAFADAFRQPAALPAPPGPPRRELPPGNLSEPQALALLAGAGVATVAHAVVHTAEEAADAARHFQGPVVLKIVSPDIVHKSDVGGVALGLRDGEAAAAAFCKVQESARHNAPTARIDGVLVAPMVAGGVECILGVHRDPVFGPMVMFGLGGVFVEVLGDVALHSAPVSQEQALAMVRSTRGFKLLDGARGRPPVDLDFLAANLVALSQLAVDASDTLQSIDINPFMALPRSQGGGCAVDAVVVGRTPSKETP